MNFRINVHSEQRLFGTLALNLAKQENWPSFISLCGHTGYRVTGHPQKHALGPTLGAERGARAWYTKHNTHDIYLGAIIDNQLSIHLLFSQRRIKL